MALYHKNSEITYRAYKRKVKEATSEIEKAKAKEVLVKYELAVHRRIQLPDKSSSQVSLFVIRKLLAQAKRIGYSHYAAYLQEQISEAEKVKCKVH